MKRFSIIGANSSIARNFCYYLKDKNVELSLYDIQTQSIDDEENYQTIDFSNKEECSKINMDCDAIFIFVGLTGAEKSVEQYSEFIDVNEKALLNVLMEYVVRGSKARIVYPSSRLVYRDSDKPLRESDPKEGLSIYALNKIAAENYIRLFHSLYGVEYTIFRISIPFGEFNPKASSYGIVSKFYLQGKENGVVSVFGDGLGVRTFTHIKDICNVLYNAGLMDETANDVFNIGGCVASLLDVATLQASRTGAKVQHIPWPALAEKVDLANGALNSEKLDGIYKIEYAGFEEC